ncbi:MAG: glucuronate isomerase [Deltaproteobacteria bacterium]|nr:glucuronate isomerase [Deltaproteobacteria bacterium]
MKSFLTENFLLHTTTAEKLYHEYAAKMPIYDYHCHVPVEEIANNKKFENITQIWLAGDHYKWRAMRSNGVPEEYITGAASDYEKFEAWAKTVPKTMRNPLYHWTHLELRSPFGIEGKLLSEETCEEIYQETSALLNTDDFSVRGIIKKMNVKVICTTDDPIDDLSYHRQIKENEQINFKVLPAFRPDKSMAVDNLDLFNGWLDKLSELMGNELLDFDSYFTALESRVDFFHQSGCRLSDHAVDKLFFVPASRSDIKSIYLKARNKESVSAEEVSMFKSVMLLEFAKMYADRGWVQQFHIGSLRNNSTRMFNALGPDTGFDSMGDHNYAEPLAKTIDALDSDNKLAKTILYAINPKDNEMIGTMIGNFQDGNVAGKMQFGSAWWFNDQKDGMERQINALSNLGLLSQFVGMSTDSRSFLSYPRHEYFRRILCNLFGNDVENGELPNDIPLIGGIIQDICFNNANTYFNM